MAPRPLAATATAVALLILHSSSSTTQSLSFGPQPPKTTPPKSLSSRSRQQTPAVGASSLWDRSSNHKTNNNNNYGRRRQQQPLRAYTVADTNKPNWMSLFMKNFHTGNPFAEFASQFGIEDSLFSFEGGGSTTKAATRPHMPNLELEAATITASIGTTSPVLEKDELLSELATLTKTFANLESSMDYKTKLYEETISTYEHTVSSLEATNDKLEKGIMVLTTTLEKQEEEIKKLQQAKSVKDDAKGLESDNDMLRQRVRALELQLSEVAFESRKVVVPPAAAIVVGSSSNVHLPKAPSAPVPPHILQQQLDQHKLDQLELQVEEYKQERKSVRKLFGLGIRRSMNKMGRALNVWNPVYNLGLWGELKGQVVV